MSIIVVPEGEERGKRSEKMFEEVEAKSIPNTAKETLKSRKNTVSYRINPRKNMPRHILIKLTKLKEKILKVTKKKQQISYKEMPIRLSADFSGET